MSTQSSFPWDGNKDLSLDQIRGVIPSLPTLEGGDIRRALLFFSSYFGDWGKVVEMRDHYPELLEALFGWLVPLTQSQSISVRGPAYRAFFLPALLGVSAAERIVMTPSFLLGLRFLHMEEYRVLQTFFSGVEFSADERATLKAKVNSSLEGEKRFYAIIWGAEALYLLGQRDFSDVLMNSVRGMKDHCHPVDGSSYPWGSKEVREYFWG